MQGGGLARKNQEIFLPDQSDPIVLSEASYVLRILPVVRNEAHRFYTTFHKQVRDKGLLDSSLLCHYNCLYY